MLKLGWTSAAALALGLIAATALPGTARAEPGKFVDGVLQPLASGFPNRPITFINVDDPGSRDGVYVRSLQEALRGIAPVDILVSDEPAPAFGSFYTLRDVATREGGTEGYYPIVVTIPGSVSDLFVEPITKETGLTIDDLNIVIVTETIPYVMIQRKDAPWGQTFAGMVEYAKANPGKLRYISNGVGSGNDIATEWVIAQTGIEVVKIPASDNQAQASAIGAGEGDFGLAQANVALQHFQAGRVDVTMVTSTSVPTPWNTDSNVVTAVDAGLPPARFGNVLAFVVPKDTPSENVQWLFELVKAGAETPHHQARTETVPGTTFNILGPEEGNALKMEIAAFIEPIVRGIGLHIDDQ
jgi:tripartite-type tricarboxylate transporter receptor subunit TctC